jgi:hypothetical protein
MKIKIVSSFLLPGLLVGAASAQTLTWTRIWGSSNTYEYGEAVARDASNNLFVAGITLGAFDGQTNAGGRDAFLTKFSPAGFRLWTRIWGSPSHEAVGGVAADAGGNLYVAGHTPGEFHGESNTRAGKTDFFLTKWSNDGQRLWTRIWGSPSNETSAGVVLNSVQWPCVAGSTDGAFGTPGQTNARPGTYDFCFSAFRTDGSFVLSSIWGGTNSDTCAAVAVDPSDRFYLAGITGRGIFDGITNAFPYNRLVLSCCAVDGSRFWTRVWGATNRHNEARAVAAGAAAVYVTGWTFGGFDGQTNYPGGNNDLFLSRFGAGGGSDWTRICGSNSWENGEAVVLDTSGGAYVAGQTGAAALDGQASAGGSDYLMMRFDSVGTRLWTRLWGSPNDDTGAKGAVLDTAGNVFVCGDTYGSFGGEVNPSAAVFWESATLSRWRMGANTPPQAWIDRPLGGREFLAGEAVPCVGRAADLDDGVATTLVWRVGGGGGEGLGPTSTVSSAVAGPQTVTLRAIDRESATGTATVVVTILADGGSGLPETWEDAYWPGGGSGGAAHDWDGDGAPNGEEWQAGTDPTNPASVFHVAAPVPETPDGRFALRWPSAGDRDYEVGVTTNLSVPFGILTNLAPTPPTNSYTPPPSPSPGTYYRVRVGR